MEIVPVESGPVDTIGYLVYDEGTNKGIIIDAPYESDEFFIDFCKTKNIKAEYLLLTHSHWDHIASAANLKKALNLKIAVHTADSYRLAEPNKHSIWYLPFEIEGFAPDFYYADNIIFESGEIKFKAVHTPGHTEGSVCLVCDEYGMIFSGDTIMFETVGRTDLPGGNTLQLINSIKNNILSLPDEYKIYGGHGPQSSVGHERKHNPFLSKSASIWG